MSVIVGVSSPVLCQSPGSILILFFFLSLFIYSCAESLLLRAGFLELWRVGAALHCSTWASFSRGFSCCRARALGIELGSSDAWA